VCRLTYNDDVVAFKMGRRQDGPSRTGVRGRIPPHFYTIQRDPDQQERKNGAGWALRYCQSGSDRLEKQPTDLRRHHHYMRDGTLTPMNLYPPVPISFLGIGLMGKPMAMNLIKAGYRVTVWNRTASKAADLISAGARLAKSPADSTRDAEAVVLMLENGAIVTELLFERGAASACREGTLIIDMSSIAPAIAEDHARLLQQAGLRYIDAPVSGGTSGAEKAALAIMAGGAISDITEAGPIFAALGKVTHVGPHGRGQLCKLVNQCIVAVTIGAVAEGLLLAEAGGADPAQVRKAILGGFCQSRILELHGQRMIERNFTPGGLIKNQIKDLDAALEVASRLGVTLPLTQQVRQLFVDLAESGKEMLDHSALILRLEALATGGGRAVLLRSIKVG
jgi:2-hydroxy-3-oxopropionate reductase